MTSHRIGVIGLGQRSARILVAMKEIGTVMELDYDKAIGGH